MSEEKPRNKPGRPKKPLAADGGSDTLSSVLDAAEDALTARGYAGMALDTVARQSGFTKAALYHHFPGGKNDLILAVALRMVARDAKGIAHAIASADAADAAQARAQLRAVTDWVLSENRHSARMLRDAQRFLPPLHSQTIAGRFWEGVYAPLEQVMRRGVETGELRVCDTEFVTWAFLSLLGEFAALPEEFPGDAPNPHSAPNVAEQIVALLFNGIGQKIT